VGERERVAPRAGGAYLNMMMPSMKVAQRCHLALDGDPPLRDVVEGHADLVLCVGLRVDLRERDEERSRERAREDKDGPHPRVRIRPRPRGDKGGRFFLPSAWWVQNFR
jgi:hypothetical protein